MIGHLILRLTIWFLLTSDLSPANIFIGVCIAFLLPHRHASLESLREWGQVLWKIVLAVPLAYLEAFQMMIWPHNYEDTVLEKVPSQRTPWLVFLDVFLITFTPKTIVSRYRKDGYYEVHRIQARRTP